MGPGRPGPRWRVPTSLLPMIRPHSLGRSRSVAGSDRGVGHAGRRHSQRKPKVCYPLPTRPRRHARARRGGAGEGPASEGASGREKTAPIANVAPTLADLRVLWGGRDRLLRVAEVAEHLGVCNATVYGLCERGELPHVWMTNSIRIRPCDLHDFIAARVTVPAKRRPHRPKPRG